MTDAELLALNRAGFIPGPKESEKVFLERVESVRQAFFKLGEQTIPKAHWLLPSEILLNIFSFFPESLPAFYSDRSLAPWQGAAAWVERDQIIAIQLRKAFRKGSFLKLYDRDELLAHEAVHAARSAFDDSPLEELFAYMSSLKGYRRVLGPMIQRPWEVWPFLSLSFLGAFFPGFFLLASFWLALGFTRLFKVRLVLKKAIKQLQKRGFSDKKALAILFRLTFQEVKDLSHGKDIFDKRDKKNIRWRLIHLLEEYD